MENAALSNQDIFVNFDFDDENLCSSDDLKKINKIEIVSYRKKTSMNSFSINNVLNIFRGKKNVYIQEDPTKTKQTVPFNAARRFGISKVVTINNISGHNAWVMLAPSQLIQIGSIGINKIGEISFTTTGECKVQQMSILNNSRSEYDLDNSQSYVSLFLYINDKWKKVWLDRLFNTRTCNINILAKHVKAATDFNFMRRE